MYNLTLLSVFSLSVFVILEPSSHNIPSLGTGPQDFRVIQYNCEDHQQKHCTNTHLIRLQVTLREFEPQEIESTNIIATLYSKARAKTFADYKITGKFSEKKVHCSQASNEYRIRLDLE